MVLSECGTPPDWYRAGCTRTLGEESPARLAARRARPYRAPAHHLAFPALGGACYACCLSLQGGSSRRVGLVRPECGDKGAECNRTDCYGAKAQDDLILSGKIRRRKGE